MQIPVPFEADDADAWHALGNLLFDTGRFDEALRCFEFATASRDFNYDPPQ